MKYLANAFSLDMLSNELDHYIIYVHRITKDEFCREISDAISYVAHQATVELIKRLCNVEKALDVWELKLSIDDILYVIQVRKRLEEGRVLSTKELDSLLKQDLIAFYVIEVK